MSNYNIPEELFYNKDHEWVKIEDDTAIVGVSDFAQDLLTDVVFVELPEVGKQVAQFAPTCVVESVKSVSDVYAPVSGTVSEVNTELEAAPEAVNNDPYGAGWMFKLTGINVDETKNLLNAAGYKELIEKEAH